MEELIPTNWEENHSIIKVIGVGGGGCNAVNYMFHTEIKDVTFLVCNTDAQALEYSPIYNKLQLGEKLTGGRGTGCDPELGRKAALESKDKIINLLKGQTEMVFIVAGMGGGTGTGAAPVIAEAAKQMGLLTVCVVTLPFRDEGEEFLRRALDGIYEMQKYADSLLIIDNQKLYYLYGDLPIREAFLKTDDVLNSAVKAIAEIVTYHGYINVDFADVKMVMKESGVAMMGSGSASGERRAIKAVDEAFSSPLLNDVDLCSARNVLVNIRSGEEKALKIGELAQIMESIKEHTQGVSNFKRGVVYDPTLGETIHITIVATGLNMSNLPQIPHFTQEVPIERVILGDAPPITKEVAPFKPTQENDFEAVLDDPYIFMGDHHPPFRRNNQKMGSTVKDKPALILTPGEKITYYENTPAFIRQGKKMDLLKGGENEVRRLKMEQQNGKQFLSTNNSYIHQQSD